MQKLSFAKKKKLIIIIALVIAVQAICLCCVSVAFAGERNEPEHTQAETSINAQKDVYEELFNEMAYVSSINRARWLRDLMNSTGEKMNFTGVKMLCDEAEKRGIEGDISTEALYLPLTRDFVCSTLCSAMDYPARDIGSIADASEDMIYIRTAAYYGYFLPDDDGKIHPEAAVTAEEYDSLLAELEHISVFKGKNLLAFGDSIMYGTGNNGEGIAKMISEKYGMVCADYSVPGQTMGTCKSRGHIPDQVTRAVKDNAKADIILINGGTNDMFLTELGMLTRGFDMSKTTELTFTGGFERMMWQIKNNRDVPIVYIRAHNMALGKSENEVKFGERGLEIAEKWGAAQVDIYTDSGLDTEDPIQRDIYTYHNPKLKYAGDSIHPTALCYAKFYLRPIGESMLAQYEKTIKAE